TSVATGDFTGDGLVDLAIGAPSIGVGDAVAGAFGAVYLFFGSAGVLPGVIDLAVREADLTVIGADANDRLGSGGLAIGNVNGDGPGDLIIGVPLADSVGNARTGAGEVRVVFGRKR
ncbi:MAG: integrin alpha, partial [Acidobacteriota bacterium]